MDLIKTWYDDRYYSTLHFDTNLIELDLDSMSQECKKSETCMSVVSESFQSICMEYGILLRLVGVMSFILILSEPLNIQRREPYL